MRATTRAAVCISRLDISVRCCQPRSADPSDS
eukprot:COSAG01_NODE_80741_length_117_cov_77.000000_1_plen_31_part_01